MVDEIVVHNTREKLEWGIRAMKEEESGTNSWLVLYHLSQRTCSEPAEQICCRTRKL